ncbi:MULTISPECIES: PA2778 family cysteine peptidase [unclassified Sulfurospirillum]|uniref:PA2778 family cysteine peptidase n=1 Tax=unclassified Sulfurospirillum TaxID=2618290 RepID=UPI000500347C|nr:MULTISPECIES: PA2778 family cysteine peptidase [unclassified Sulfurospirillum]KFL35430.1 hypothetical protein JU57_01435 [Sulfurospirillum sp. SCADC]
MKRLLLCAALLLFTGCVSKNYDYLSADKSIAQSKKLSLTIYPQEAYFCGPASLATLLTHQNVEFVYGDVVGTTFTPELAGTLQMEMKATARRYGLIPYALNAGLAPVLSEVSNNTPVLVLFNLGLTPLPAWHYAVVTGFDTADKKVFLSAPKGDQTWMSFDDFEMFSKRGGSWAVVALKPPLLPIASNETAMIRAITDMYDVGYKEQAKLSAINYVATYPSSTLGSVMLANMYMEMQDYLNATTEYKRALALKPHDPVLLNNLAQSLMRENKLREAKQYALEAVDIGGVFSVEYQKTLEEIKRRLQE